MRRPRLHADDGSTLPLTIFYGFLALVLILLVVAASSLSLERKRLFSVADAAALVGSEAFPLDAVQASDGHQHPTLSPTDVEAAVRDFLSAQPTGGFESLRIEKATSSDGESATVTLSAYWRPPVLSLLVPDGFRVEVTTRARSVFS